VADEGEDDEGWLTSTTRSIRSNVVAGSSLIPRLLCNILLLLPHFGPRPDSYLDIAWCGCLRVHVVDRRLPV
jgi:hypothetical protein